MLEQFSVDGNTAVITGSSQGIGAVTAKRFADDGANVVVTSRTQEKIDEVAAEINDSDRPGEAIAVECDVRDRDSVEALIEATVEEFGAVDCMVNNAGASFMAGFDDISENGWKTIVDINLHGTFHGAQVAGQQMQQQESGGTIINFASVAGTMGSQYMSHYGAAKAAVVNLTTSLSANYADHDIRVNCIAPGLVGTAGVASQMGLDPADVDRSDIAKEMGLPEEIADIVQFLASDASSYIVGETITAQGVPPLEDSQL
ncbi:glucose 1-dehydrogenase [Natronomonas gomsonensis]|uniref:SDR family NAD(P)-dependent oxidoreductase n=1 Tax=Natronomonas gomsonensis TaxID=1046043 RepID=UPI0020CA63B9|nr:glucose 1-dehydrogenase [Natronomonas gomsonensis]MCY4731983.1 glucose 1-dehydrogenase [Natronomonas gomsonensis]